MPFQITPNENTPTRQHSLFTGFAVFYLLCVVALILLPEFMEGAPRWVAQIFEARMKLLGFIAAACVFLTVIVKYITDEPKQWTPELSLGIVGGLAGFSVALLFVQEEANLYAQAALVVLAIPVLHSNYLLAHRLYLDMQHSVVARIYAQILIWAYRIAGLMVAFGVIVGALQGIFAAFGIVIGVLIISVIILILATAVALLTRRAFLNGN